MPGNQIAGNKANNSLHSGDGNDTMVGALAFDGSDNDTLYGDNGK